MTDDEEFINLSKGVIKDSDSTKRLGRVHRIRNELTQILAQLDELGAWQAGAHVASAITALEASGPD